MSVALELGVTHSDAVNTYYASDPAYTYGFLAQEGAPAVKGPQEIDEEIRLRRDRMGLGKVTMVVVEGSLGWLRKYKQQLKEPDVIVYVGDETDLAGVGITGTAIVDRTWREGEGPVDLDKTIKSRLRSRRRKKAAPNVSGMDPKEYYGYNEPHVVVEAMGPMGGYVRASKPIPVPWEGDVTVATIEATESAVRDAPPGTTGPYWLIGNGQFGDAYILAWTDDLAEWQAPQPQPGREHREITNSVYNGWVAGADPLDIWRAFAETAANTVVEGMTYEGDHTQVEVYRGIAIKRDGEQDPTKSTAEGAGRGSGLGAGYSWTIDEDVAEVIAERGGAGFQGDNTTRGAYEWYPYAERKNVTPTVLRATVDLSQEGVSLYHPPSARYKSEQEVQIQPGTPFVMTGYKQAHPVPVSSAAVQEAERRYQQIIETGVDPEYNNEPYPEEHRPYVAERVSYLVRWEWGDWVEGSWQRTAAVDLRCHICKRTFQSLRGKEKHYYYKHRGSQYTRHIRDVEEVRGGPAPAAPVD